MRAAVLLVIFLAGCSAQPPVEDTDIQTGPDTGAISGIVVDELIQPIEGASITMSEAATVTDATGRFVFEDLPPGVYFLTASAPGFLPTQASVAVEAGSVAKPKMLLPADPRPSPYQQTLQFDGFIQFSPGIVGFFAESLLNGSAVDLCECSLFVRPDQNVSTYVLDILYDENVASPVSHAGYYWELDQIESALVQESGYGHSPINAHVPASIYGDQELMMARFTGPDDWVSVQQDFEMFVTVFYHGAAPSDWSLAT